MNWFKKVQKHSVCKECGVHFDPVTGYEARWGDLCSTHRKPVIERDEKKAKVMAWAGRNLERLTEQMEKETAEELKAYYDNLNTGALAASRIGQNQNIFGLSGRM